MCAVGLITSLERDISRGSETGDLHRSVFAASLGKQGLKSVENVYRAWST